MNELSELVLKEYQVRRTKKQKIKFINLLKEKYPDLKVEEGGFLHNRNIVFGDLEKSDVVVTAHYDTCAILPFPNFITPTNIWLYILYNVLVCLYMFLPSDIIGGLCYYFTNDFDLAYLLGEFILILVLIMFLVGIPNKHTANDNTSGVITILELLERMTEEERNKTCLVLFDNEENGLFGSMFFANKHKKEMKNKLLINLDCVSDGNNLLLVVNKNYYDKYKDVLKETFVEDNNKVFINSTKNTIYPSDQVNFKESIAVSYMNNTKNGLLYMNKIHTKKDVVFQKENIIYLVDRLRKFINKIDTK